MLAEVHTRTLSSFIQTHNLDHHLYTHDTHIYLSLATPDTYFSLDQLMDCVQNIVHWITDIKLRFYANKTEFPIIGTQKQRGKLDCIFPTTEVHTGHLN